MAGGIKPGMRARIRGLVSRADLNGETVTVVKKLKNGRVQVELWDTKASVAIKPTNLEAVESDMYGNKLEECPLCMDEQMDTSRNSSYMPCCGQPICIKCFTRLCSTSNRDKCPFCRSDTTFMGTNDAGAWVESIRKRACRGDANAMYNLATAYDTGDGVRTDQALARKWYALAADKGEARAAYNLALSFRDGEGGPVDKGEAARYFRTAGERGHAEGCTLYGVALLHGDGMGKDISESVKWLKRGKAGGDFLAERYLGMAEMMSKGANVSMSSGGGGMVFSASRR